jgi:hypothetical protein
LNFKTLPAAELEAAEAAIWYDAQRPGLGDEFLNELQDTFGRIKNSPESFGSLEGYSGPLEIRRCMLQRFPYVVVFLHRSEEIVAVAVSHARRRPLYWLTRLN